MYITWGLFYLNFGGFLCKLWYTHSKVCSPVIIMRIPEDYRKDIKYKKRKKNKRRT